MDNFKQESETLELKETVAEKESAGFDIVAFANKEGGSLFFGARNNGKVIGCPAEDLDIRKLAEFFSTNIEPTLNISLCRVEIDGRFLIEIQIPKSITPYHTFKQRFALRIGTTSKTQGMQSEYQKRLITYGMPEADVSARLAPGASIDDLDSRAITVLRSHLKSSGRFTQDVDQLNDLDLLKNLRLVVGNGTTFAALILLGRADRLEHYLPHAEIKYQYKTSEEHPRGQDMLVYEGGYLLNYAAVWAKIDSRNLQFEVPEGLFLRNLRAFDEQTVREVVNNAVIHRDYLQAASILITQLPTDIEVQSPGSLPDGVTMDNILKESRPRNKLIARVLRFCGFVDEFGSGVNLMFQNQLACGKSAPLFTITDRRVSVRIDGIIHDVEFVRYVTKIMEKYGRALSDEELILLDSIRRGERLPIARIPKDFLQRGLIERVGYGKYILSKEYYRSAGSPIEYTKRKGLSKIQKKAMLLQALKDFPEGARKADLMSLFDNTVQPMQLYRWLVELKEDGRVVIEGKPTSPKAKWKLIQL